MLKITVFSKNFNKFSGTHYRRNLQSNSSPTFSVVSGNGTNSFNAGELVVIDFASYDCFNNSLSTGGSQLTLELTEYDTNNSIVSVTNNSFTDNNDGTYSITFTASQEGYVSYNIHISGNCTVWADYWDNINFTGSSDYFCTYDRVTFEWLNSSITLANNDSVSATFQGKIMAPETNTYTIYLDHDDGARLYIDSIPVIVDWTDGNKTNSTSYSMTQDQVYQIQIDYYDNANNALLDFDWEYGSVSRTYVPFVQDSMQYSSLTANSPYDASVLAPICGNGKRHSIEQCDDGNSINGDGWDSNCTIEQDYVWVGGSANSSDSW